MRWRRPSWERLRGLARGLFSRLRCRWPWVVIALALAVLFGATLVAHMANGGSHFFFNDDARIAIFPFYRFSDPTAFQGDFLGDYVLAWLPVGFKGLYAASAYLWDAEALSKILPYPLLLTTVIALGIAAHRLAGPIAAFTAMALCLGSELYLATMGGGLPRAFAYPLLACALAALVSGRIRLLAVLVWLGAAFYPVAAVPIGLGLAAVLLLLRDSDRGEARGWSWFRRFRFLGLTAAVAGLLVLPTVLSSGAYGPRVTPDLLPAYPEAGPAGTHGPEDRPPYGSITELPAKTVKRAVLGAGRPWSTILRSVVEEHGGIFSDVLLLLMLLGWAKLATTDPAARRFLMLLLGAIGAHLLARLLAPYLYAPSRYLLYSVPPLLLVALATTPLGLVSWWRRASLGPWAKRGAMALGSLGLLLFVGGPGHPSAGLTVRVDSKQQRLYAAVAALPATSLIAGWPDDPMSNLPYLARRRAWMTGELHIALHVGYLDRVRERLRPFFAAYLASETAPLARFREMGVTHILLELSHLRRKVPAYVHPMQLWITEAERRARGRGYELLRQLPWAAVYRDRRFALVDLSRLRTGTPSAPGGRVPGSRGEIQ